MKANGWSFKNFAGLLWTITNCAVLAGCVIWIIAGSVVTLGAVAAALGGVCAPSTFSCANALGDSITDYKSGAFNNLFTDFVDCWKKAGGGRSS
jgi:hypothetical protein